MQSLTLLALCVVFTLFLASEGSAAARQEARRAERQRNRVLIRQQNRRDARQAANTVITGELNGSPYEWFIDRVDRRLRRTCGSDSELTADVIENAVTTYCVNPKEGLDLADPYINTFRVKLNLLCPQPSSYNGDKLGRCFQKVINQVEKKCLPNICNAPATLKQCLTINKPLLGDVLNFVILFLEGAQNCTLPNVPAGQSPAGRRKRSAEELTAFQNSFGICTEAITPKIVDCLSLIQKPAAEGGCPALATCLDASQQSGLTDVLTSVIPQFVLSTITDCVVALSTPTTAAPPV